MLGQACYCVAFHRENHFGVELEGYKVWIFEKRMGVFCASMDIITDMFVLLDQ